MTTSGTNDYQLGSWRVRPSLNRLESAGKVVSLEPRAMAALCHLAGKSGATVSKDELLAEVWGGIAVSDNAVSRVIAQLRKALDDDAQAPSYIETIVKKGYRLVTTVEPWVPSATAPSSHDAPKPRGWQPVALFGLGLLGLGLLIALAGFTRLAPPETHGVLRPLTSLSGSEQDPAWSPDGRYLAFAHTPADTHQSRLYLRPRTGEPLTRLTETGLSERAPAWSPDGRRLVFLRGDLSACSILIATLAEPPRFADVRELAPCQHFPYATLRWGADGQIYLSDRETALTPVPSRLWRLDPRDGRRTALTEPPPHGLGDRAPALSPDGRVLAFLRTPYWSESEIRLRDLGSGEERVLARLDHAPRSLSFSRDGRELVYEDNRDGGRVMGLPLDGDGPSLRFSTPTGVGALAAGPGPKELSFVSELSDSNLWATPLAGGEARRVTASSRYDGKAQFAPRDRRLAFASERSGRPALWLQEDGTDRMLAEVPDGSAIHRLRWGPDGRRILISTGSRRLYLYALAGGKLSPVDTGTGGASLGEWAPDGDWVYFSSDRDGDWQIWRTALAGGHAERVTRAGGYGGQADASGTRLFYTKYTSTGLWRMDLATGRESVLLPAFCPCAYDHWLLRPEGIYQLERQALQSRFYRYELVPGEGDRGEQVLLRSLPATSNEFTLSADGSALVFCRLDRAESDLAVYASD
ncbi:MAG: PD40 domain-containing protein [Gammaproteobacteria bacterium]|nr:PD40 domain-containing protein [Gammaproteobacteria bacterium]